MSFHLFWRVPVMGHLSGSSSRPHKNVTARGTPPGDSGLLRDSVALPLKSSSLLGSCCCKLESYIKLKKQRLHSQHSNRVGDALLAPGVPNEDFPWWILGPILGWKNWNQQRGSCHSLLFGLSYLQPSLLWLISVLCVKLQLLVKSAQSDENCWTFPIVK